MEDTAKTNEELIEECLDKATDEQIEKEAALRELQIVKDLNEYDNDDLYEEVKRRDLEHLFQEECEEEHISDFLDQVNPQIQELDLQKIQLFMSHMDNLDLDQWRHQFKQIARLSSENRKRLPEEFTNVLDQQV